MDWNLKQNKSTYILRYYLPCEPVFDKKVTEQRQFDLLKLCQNADIKAVMFYVDSNSYWYYMPDNIKHTEYLVNIINETAIMLRSHNISYQLNYQNLFGAWDGGADLRDVNGWENYVDEKGTQSMGCGCTIGKKFREIAGYKLRLWAKTKPDVIWIDDDFRMHNHRTGIYDFWNGKSNREYLDFGCFCPEHIKSFNKLYNTSYTREEIVKACLAGGEPHKMRKMWLDFVNESVSETARWISKTVHDVSPDTKIAQMTSMPDVHAVEGRNWSDFLSNLSNGKKPIIRAHFGPFSEENPRDFNTSYTTFEQLKTNVESQYKRDVDYCPEVENTRFTVWSKSLAATRYQLMLSAFLGCRGITLSIYDLEGCIFDEEKEFENLLIGAKPFLNSLSKMNLYNWETEGVALLTSPDRIERFKADNDMNGFEQLSEGRMWDKYLTKMGVPCKYTTPENLNKCKVVAVDGYTAKYLTDDEILNLLSKGVLIDSGAAKVFQDRGLSEHIGVTVGEKVNCIAATEVIKGYIRKDGSMVRVPSRIIGNKWNRLIIHEEAKQVTSLITPYGDELNGIVSYKNTLGGNVYTYAANGNLGDGFFTNYRVKLFKEILSNLSQNTLFEVNNPSFAITVVKKIENSAAIFVANLSSDCFNNISITTYKDAKTAYYFDENGNKKELQCIEKGKIILSNINLNIFDTIVIIVNF